MLAEENKLKDEHLKFLINKYTKQLNLQYLISCEFSTIDERLQEMGSVCNFLCYYDVYLLPTPSHSERAQVLIII